MMHTLFHLCLLLIRLLCANIDKNLNGPNVNESTQQNYRKLRVGIWFHCNPRLKRMIITNIIIFIEHWWANKVAYDVFLRYFYFFFFCYCCDITLWTIFFLRIRLYVNIGCRLIALGSGIFWQSFSSSFNVLTSVGW